MVNEGLPKIDTDALISIPSEHEIYLVTLSNMIVRCSESIVIGREK